jgi:hypothetical protein
MVIVRYFPNATFFLGLERQLDCNEFSCLLAVRFGEGR